MISNLNKTAYKAFGLTIFSEIPLPELLFTAIEDNESDVVIERSEKLLLTMELNPEDVFVSKKDQVLFHVPEAAIFLIQDGKRIVFSPFDGADEDEIRLYILGTCMGALLLQRKILPLHGSAIAINGKAYAFVGDSGAGKSTLATAFLKRGFQLLSDDVIPVTLNSEKIPIVTPAYPHQKLWLESLDRVVKESGDYEALILREDKFAIPVLSQFATEPLPLAGVFELIKGDNKEIELQPILNLQRFYSVYRNTYRNFFMQGAGLMEWHFETTSKMVNQIDFYQLRRPTTRFTAHDLTDLILTTLTKGSEVE